MAVKETARERGWRRACEVAVTSMEKGARELDRRAARISELQHVLLKVSRMMNNNEMPKGYRDLQREVDAAIRKERWE